jgi:hypothetical protein
VTAKDYPKVGAISTPPILLLAALQRRSQRLTQ